MKDVFQSRKKKIPVLFQADDVPVFVIMLCEFSLPSHSRIVNIPT